MTGRIIFNQGIHLSYSRLGNIFEILEQVLQNNVKYLNIIDGCEIPALRIKKNLLFKIKLWLESDSSSISSPYRIILKFAFKNKLIIIYNLKKKIYILC